MNATGEKKKYINLETFFSFQTEPKILKILEPDLIISSIITFIIPLILWS